MRTSVNMRDELLARLNDIAKGIGYKSWRCMLTGISKGEVQVAKVVIGWKIDPDWGAPIIHQQPIVQTTGTPPSYWDPIICSDGKPVA